MSVYLHLSFEIKFKFLALLIFALRRVLAKQSLCKHTELNYRNHYQNINNLSHRDLMEKKKEGEDNIQ